MGICEIKCIDLIKGGLKILGVFFSTTKICNVKVTIEKSIKHWKNSENVETEESNTWRQNIYF